MRRIFKKIHLWLSVPFGLIITITCLTGAILVFENEIGEWTTPQLYYVNQVKDRPLPVNEVIERVAATLPDSVEITGVAIHSDPHKAYQVSLSKPRRTSIVVDQYTGQIKGLKQRTPFFTFTFRAHRWLLDSMKPDGGIFWGKMVVGVSTLMFVFVLLTGAVIWIPKSIRSLKNRLKINIRKGCPRFWYDLHVSAGIYAIPLLLVMALTGLTWSFPWYRSGLYALFGAETTQSQAPHAPKKRNDTTPDRKPRGAEQESKSYTGWNRLYAELAAQNPTFEKISIANTKATVSFDRWGNQRAADSYKLNPQNADIAQVDRYDEASQSTKLRGWIYSLHVGNWGGWLSKTISFIAALIGASLPITGYYLWIKRAWCKRKPAIK